METMTVTPTSTAPAVETDAELLARLSARNSVPVAGPAVPVLKPKAKPAAKASAKLGSIIKPAPSAKGAKPKGKVKPDSPDTPPVKVAKQKAVKKTGPTHTPVVNFRLFKQREYAHTLELAFYVNFGGNITDAYLTAVDALAASPPEDGQQCFALIGHEAENNSAMRHVVLSKDGTAIRPVNMKRWLPIKGAPVSIKVIKTRDELNKELKSWTAGEFRRRFRDKSVASFIGLYKTGGQYTAVAHLDRHNTLHLGHGETKNLAHGEPYYLSVVRDLPPKDKAVLLEQFAAAKLGRPDTVADLLRIRPEPKTRAAAPEAKPTAPKAAAPKTSAKGKPAPAPVPTAKAAKPAAKRAATPKAKPAPKAAHALSERDAVLPEVVAHTGPVVPPPAPGEEPAH